MSIRTCKHMERNICKNPVRDDLLLKWIVQNWSLALARKDNVKCMHEGKVYRVCGTPRLCDGRGCMHGRKLRNKKIRLLPILEEGHSRSHCWNIFQQWSYREWSYMLVYESGNSIGKANLKGLLLKKGVSARMSPLVHTRVVIGQAVPL